MRRTLIVSFVAAIALAGVAGGAAYAAGSSGAGQAVISTTEPGATATTTPESIPPAAFDPATVAAVFQLLGLDQATVGCVVSETEFAEPTDDTAAVLVLNTCGVGPLQLLEAIVALDAESGAIVTEDSAVVEDTVTVTLPAPGTDDSSGTAFLDGLLDTLETFGITVDDDQRQCLLDNASELTDLAGSLDVFELCGIDVADLLLGG